VIGSLRRPLRAERWLDTVSAMALQGESLSFNAARV
jgi:hypothetical protein